MELIMELGVEGGSISLKGMDQGNGWIFVVSHDESTMAGLLSEEDARGMSFSSKSQELDSLQKTVRYMDEHYPYWPNTFPCLLHPEFAEEIGYIALDRCDDFQKVKWKLEIEKAHLKKLGTKAQKGSKPRCHLLLRGDKKAVADRLNELIQPYGQITEEDVWMPKGFKDITEAQLGKHLLPDNHQNELTSWWLKINHPRANTPNWDIASTCTIDGKKGILLVEAKAHTGELSTGGKTLKYDASKDSIDNDKQIRSCIEEASKRLTEATNKKFSLSVDRCYQMSNRFAWACKLAELGYPVILLYLGFTNANEMADGKSKLAFETELSWVKAVKKHSNIIIDDVWGCRLAVSGNALYPMIRSIRIDLPS